MSLLVVLALALSIWLGMEPLAFQESFLTRLGAMDLFALAIVSEYLLRILDEARRRPPFVVERGIGGRDDQA